MRTLLSALVLLACPFLSLPLTAQQLPLASRPAPNSSDSQAEALWQRAFTSLTGGTLVSDATLTGTAARTDGSDSESGTVLLKANSSGDSRIDLRFPSGTRSEVRNHAAIPAVGSLPTGIRQADLPSGLQARVSSTSQRVGVWTGPDGVRHAMANHNAISEPTWFVPAITFERLHADHTMVVSYEGEETRNDKPVLHLSISEQPAQASGGIAAFLRHLSQIEVFLDPSTFLPAALEFNTHPENNAAFDIPTEIRFSDYRAVNGSQVPFHVQRYVNNSLVLDLQIESVTLGSDISSTGFAVQ